MPDYDLVPVDYQPDWSDLPAPHGVPQLSVGPQQPLDPIASNTPTSLVPQAALNAVQPAVQGAVDWAAAPGQVLQSQGPQVGQPWTDEDEALRQLNAEAAPDWGAQTALNMVGVGTPFAETGAAGVAGGKLGDAFIARGPGENIGHESLDGLSREGHFYRGMSEAEYNATIGSGKGIQSNLSASIPNAEGTNFSSDLPTAESYANFGRTDPRITGLPNYLVEVSGGDDLIPKRDGYFHARNVIPPDRVTRVWQMSPTDDKAIVATPVKLGSGSTDDRLSAALTGMNAAQEAQPRFLQNAKPPSEDVYDVLSANFTHGKAIGNDVAPVASLNSGVSAGDSAKRVSNLIAQMQGPNGYWERPIVDDAGNVVEGQHRIAAAKAMGLGTVPVYRVADLGRGLPTDKMAQAIKSVGPTSSDQIHQLMAHVLDMIQESGSPQQALLDYELPAAYKYKMEAALNAATPASSIRAYSLKPTDKQPDFGNGMASGGSVKATKTQAHYRGGTKGKRCGICTMFQPPNSCASVRGHISDKALCDYYEARKEATGEPAVNRRYDVPFLAGSSNDDKTVYIDRRVPKRIAVKRANGKGYVSIDPAEFLAAHETSEHKAMRAGKSYEKAHIEDGTAAERALVKAKGLDWISYEEVMDGLLSHIEHEHPKRPPPDLYTKPYPHSKAKLLEREAKKEAA